MSDRDDLIDLIDGATWSLIDSDVVADAILAAGWRAPQPTHWKCGHEITVGNRGHDGDCIPCTIKRWEAGETTWNQ